MQFNKINTLKEAQGLIKILPDVIALDTEYVKGNPRTTKLLSVIVADDQRAWAIPPSLLPVLSSTIRARKLIFLQDYNHCDTTILLKHGLDIRGTNTRNLIDMHHLYDENAEHSLDSRCKIEFNDNYKDVFWSKYKNFEDAPEDEALEYQCKDAIYTYRLGLKDSDEVDWNLYGHVEKLSKSLLETELKGLKVNVELMQKTKDQLEKEISECLPKLRSEFEEYCEVWEYQEWEAKIDKLKSISGKLRVPRPTFNFESGKQVAWLVYEALKCPVISKTKTGNPSTDFETLQTLSESEERLRNLVRFKDLKTLYGTFVEGMLKRVDNGRIYPHFNVSGTKTGRISHSDPNMGNLPKTGVVRNFFIPDEGMVLIGADYAQLEVVVEANLTNDPNLIRIINEGVSKHDITAEGLKIDRNTAKTINFALQYGASASKIKEILKRTNTEAEDIFRRYWDLYSGIYAFKKKVNEEIDEKGQITNLAGRVRHFPVPTNRFEQYEQQRQAYNFLIQGVAAECCNRAFYRYGGLFSVHDEIVAQCPIGKAEEEKARLVSIMEKVSEEFGFKYPLKAQSYGPFDKWQKA